MWYYDTMEPEGGGQDKAKGLLARRLYNHRKGATGLHSGKRLFLCIYGIGGKKVLPGKLGYAGRARRGILPLEKIFLRGLPSALGDTREQESR